MKKETQLKEYEIVLLSSLKPSVLGYMKEFGEPDKLALSTDFGFDQFNAALNFVHKPVYMYLVSNDPILNNDWIIWNGILTKAKERMESKSNMKKVISSNDDTITPGSIIPMSFVKYYIESYNEQKPLKKVTLKTIGACCQNSHILINCIRSCKDSIVIPRTDHNGNFMIVSYTTQYNNKEVNEKYNKTFTSSEVEVLLSKFVKNSPDGLKSWEYLKEFIETELY